MTCPAQGVEGRGHPCLPRPHVHHSPYDPKSFNLSDLRFSTDEIRSLLAQKLWFYKLIRGPKVGLGESA